MIGTNLHRYYEGKFIVPDFETENLTLRYNRPWMAAWLIADNKKIYESKCRYIKWDDLDVSPDAARLTRFNRLEYSRLARPPADVLAELDADLYNPEYKNVWHNPLSFDVYIHDYLRLLMGLPSDFSYLPRLVDTNCVSKAYLKGIKPDLTNFLAWQYKMTDLREKGLKTNLGAMCKNLSIPFDDGKAHDGAYDVQKNLELYKELVYKVEF